MTDDDQSSQPESPPESPPTTRRTHYQSVLQAIIDLSDIHRAATRQQIVRLTALKFQAVDDVIKRLKADGRVFSPMPGLFEPVPTTPPDRAITVTRMPSGAVKVEIADGPDVELTSHEARSLGKLLAGLVLETSQVESYRMLAEQVARLQQRVSVPYMLQRGKKANRP